MDLTRAVLIDGSQGEGGGQILRAALALAAVTGRPFAMENIRARRAKPGLMRQHAMAVTAAARVCNAAVDGCAIGSTSLRFVPGKLTAGAYEFDIGSAGSTMLVLQAILPALALADGPSTVVLRGGTHNPMAPPFEFFAKSLVPLLARLGWQVTPTLLRHGFYPAGGGCVRVETRGMGTGPARVAPFVLRERGALLDQRVRATIAHIADHVAMRELTVLADAGVGAGAQPHIQRAQASCAGNAVEVELTYEFVTHVTTSLGERKLSAERVARAAVNDVKRYQASNAPVDEYLCDQLILPLALGGGGSYRATSWSPHAEAQCVLLRTWFGREVVTVSDVGRGGSDNASDEGVDVAISSVAKEL